MRYVLLLLLLSGCVGKKYPSKEMLSKAGVKVFAELLDNYDLNIIRCTSNNGKRITSVVTDYFYDREVDMMTARYLLHTAVEKYLENVSQSFEMKPFLKDGMITRKNMECTIFFRKHGRDLGAISSVTLLNEKVSYNRFDKESGLQSKIHDEKYK